MPSYCCEGHWLVAAICFIWKRSCRLGDRHFFGVVRRFLFPRPRPSRKEVWQMISVAGPIDALLDVGSLAPSVLLNLFGAGTCDAASQQAQNGT